MSSMNWTLGSMTQMSGRARSVTAPYVRDMSPMKIASCWVISSDANVRPIMMPRYLARSPTNILGAMRFIGAGPAGYWAVYAGGAALARGGGLRPRGSE